MLQSLTIKNFILIEKLDLDLREGFSAITGETGAGKSILLDAILFCFGEKVSREIIKFGADSAAVTLCFSTNPGVNSFLEEYEIDTSEQEVIIKRTLAKDGKNKHLVNDQPVTKKLVSELFNYLIEIHGQHSHTELLNAKLHLPILDEFAGNQDLLAEVRQRYETLKNIQSQINAIIRHKEETEKEIEYLEHSCAELAKADIKNDEYEYLSDLKIKLQNRDKEIYIIQDIIASINSAQIEQVIVKSQKNIAKSSNVDVFNQAEKYLEIAYDSIESAKSELTEYLRSFDKMDHTLNDVEGRLQLIKDLSRKHGCLPGEIQEFLDKSQAKLDELKNLINNTTNLEKQCQVAHEEYLKSALVLSNMRHNAINLLENKTHEELSMLQMQKAKFVVEIASEHDVVSPNGIDIVRFTAATNPGTQPAPIDKIASGGELSRFMLAFRAALFVGKQDKTMIFDEIDVGISGSVAESIGLRLKNFSKSAQLIVITHQPQVAGKADQHILVHKTQYENHTEVQVTEISGIDKSREIARMIAGSEITDASIKAANELIQ